MVRASMILTMWTPVYRFVGAAVAVAAAAMVSSWMFWISMRRLSSAMYSLSWRSVTGTGGSGVEKVAGISIVSILFYVWSVLVRNSQQFLSCQFDVVVVVNEAEGGVTYLAVADPDFLAGA